MKKILIITVLGMIFISSVGYVNIPEKKQLENEKCLEIIGVALNEKNELLDGVEVKLFKKNDEMEWVAITSVPYHNHNFKFILDENEYYTIEVSKTGYVKRLIVVSTMLPGNVSPKPIFSFGFEVMLFKEVKEADDYYLDFPIALIGYDAKKKVFDNNYNYTFHIKKNIKAELNKVKVEKMFNGKK